MLYTYQLPTCTTSTLHSVSTTESEHKVKCRLLLDVVVLQGAAILELLPSEDKTLLVWRDPLLVLDLSFHSLNGVSALHLEGDGLASECLHKDLHPSAKSEHKVKCRLLLDVVVLKGAAILELLPSKDKTLLVWRDPLLVLDLSFHSLDGVGAL